jgi:hypothetical protein
MLKCTKLTVITKFFEFLRVPLYSCSLYSFLQWWTEMWEVWKGHLVCATHYADSKFGTDWINNLEITTVFVTECEIVTFAMVISHHSVRFKLSALLLAWGVNVLKCHVEYEMLYFGSWDWKKRQNCGVCTCTWTTVPFYTVLIFSDLISFCSKIYTRFWVQNLP